MTDLDDPGLLHDVLVKPGLWDDAFDRMPSLEFALGEDEFLALGDNSTKSKDSRLWNTGHFVKRELLIGKAIFIYWPHSWHRLPGTSIPFPYFPNFPRMGFVR
jgi:signal peptidase I